MVAFGGITLQQATPAAGVALVNATPTLLTWTSPNDGNNHLVEVIGELIVTVNEVGGAISISFTDPAGNSRTNQISAGGVTTGLTNLGLVPRLVAPNTTVTVTQSSALTGGAATVWAQLWAQ